MMVLSRSLLPCPSAGPVHIPCTSAEETGDDPCLPTQSSVRPAGVTTMCARSLELAQPTLTSEELPRLTESASPPLRTGPASDPLPFKVYDHSSA